MSESCNLRCHGCQVWKTSSYGDHKERLETLLQSNFFSAYPKRPFYNLIGGEPFLAPYMQQLCQRLRHEKISVNVWSNLTVPYETLAPVLPYVNRLFVYLPYPSREEYEDLVGETLYDVLMANIREVQHQKIPIYFHTPLTIDNSSWLPYLYDFVYSLQSTLILHADLKALSVNKETKAYIKLFRRKKNVWLFQSKKGPLTQCAGLPYGSFGHSSAYIKAILYQLYLNYAGIFGGRV